MVGGDWDIKRDKEHDKEWKEKTKRASSVFLTHCRGKRGVMGSKIIQRLTGVAVVEEGGSAAAAGQEGQRRRHEPLHDAALPRAETQAAGWHKRAPSVSVRCENVQVLTLQQQKTLPQLLHTRSISHCCTRVLLLVGTATVLTRSPAFTDTTNTQQHNNLAPSRQRGDLHTF